MAQRKVGQYKEISFTYQCTGTAKFQFYTDLPGGVLAARLGSGWVLPSTAGIRTTYTVPLDGIEGTIYKPRWTPDAGTHDLIILSAVLMNRSVGVYLDGALGEFWETQPIAIGA
jgi:hypothetical protein